MKLKYQFDLESWAENSAYDSRSSLIRTIDNYTVEFRFNDKYCICGINVFIPNAKVAYDDRGKVVPDETKSAQAYLIANYVADILHMQTGKCIIVRGPYTLKLIPESEKEKRRFIEKYAGSSTEILKVDVKGHCNLSESGLNKYVNQKDAFSIYMDAKRMINPIGRYREFFRVLDHFFPYKWLEFDTKVSTYLQRFNAKYTMGLIENLRNLRNRCSHAKSKKRYITPYDLEGVKEVGANLGTIEEIAKLLINNPPP